MLKIRKGDSVQIIKGKDSGKKGNVLKVFPALNKALVEGINLVKKHRRKTQQDQQGGIVSIESPISNANLMLLCKHCNRPTRVGFSRQGRDPARNLNRDAGKVLADETKSRFCKRCNEPI